MKTKIELKKILSSWTINLKKYFVTYKNGFFELPYFANSPQSLIDSFISMPFVKHFPAQKLIKSKTPFLNAKVSYQHIEEGLMFINSQIEYKSNVHYKINYDYSLPIECYYLTFYISKNEVHTHSPVINGMNYTNKSWSFFKPGSVVSDYHFKGESGKFSTVFFTKDWFNNFLHIQDNEEVSALKYFLESKQDSIILPYLNQDNNYPLEPTFENNIAKDEEMDLAEAKQQVMLLIKAFYTQMSKERINEAYFDIDNLDRIKVMKAEKLINRNLPSRFVGISHLATEVGWSETKLKEVFKKVYGTSIFQYFQAKQMLMAKDMFTINKLKVKDVASVLGYENTSKFTAAYKKRFGFLPSETM